MWKTVRNTLIALIIIGLGAGAGWLIANATNPYATSTTSAAVTPTVASAATVTANPGASPVATVVAGGNNLLTAPAGGQNQTTPAAGSTTTPGAATTPVAQGGQGQRTQQITGTVESYDAASKKLVVNTAQGSRTIMTTTARYSKTSKFASEELAQLSASPLLIAGEKGTDGIYTARTITAVDAGSFGGGQGAPGGVAGGTGQTGGAGAGRPAGGAVGIGGAGTLILPSSTFKDGVLSGQTFQGEAVQVKLNASTSLLKQAAGAETDLKAGATVAVTTRADGETLDATLVTING